MKRSPATYVLAEQFSFVLIAFPVQSAMIPEAREECHLFGKEKHIGCLESHGSIHTYIRIHIYMHKYIHGYMYTSTHAYTHSYMISYIYREAQ